MVYHSFDSMVDDPYNCYPSEFINSLAPNGWPPHELNLKINCPVTLLRSIDPENGPCNGTRLVVQGFQRNIIDAKKSCWGYMLGRGFHARDPPLPLLGWCSQSSLRESNFLFGSASPWWLTMHEGRIFLMSVSTCSSQCSLMGIGTSHFPHLQPKKC